MRRRLDYVHPFGQQRAEARAAFEHGIPAARLLMPGPVDPAKVVRHRKLGCSGQISHAHAGPRHPRAIVDQPVDVIEMTVGQLHRIAQRAAIGRLTQNALAHPFGQQRGGDIGVEIFVKQRDQPPDFGTLGGSAVDHRRAIDRFFEIFGNRPAISQGYAFLLVHQHRGAPGGIEVEEHVRCRPRVFAHQIIGDVLFAQQQADLAAERAERELMKLPHNRSDHAAIRGPNP